ncbi:MAG TPA: hypothetical protein VII94_03415 [Candidatus Saccharimonadales bacterium]
MNQYLTVELVTTDGQIDLAESEVSFHTALVKRIAEQGVELDRIQVALDELFTENLGKSIAMPTVGSLVANKLGAVYENFKTLSDRTMEYVRANSQGKVDKATKVEERPNSLFVVRKGVNGGVSRRADIPVEASETHSV